MKYIGLLAVILACFSCQSTLEKQVGKTEDISTKQALNPSPKLSLDSLWQELAFAKGGCLTGGQYLRNGHFGMGECVMTRSKGWKAFFSADEEQLSQFLLAQFADTSHTQIHTCPFENATVGELAVYSLQNLYRVNWFDLDAFTRYRDKEITSGTDNHQNWLQQILADDDQRQQLKEAWLEEELKQTR